MKMPEELLRVVGETLVPLNGLSPVELLRVLRVVAIMKGLDVPYVVVDDQEDEEKASHG